MKWEDQRLKISVDSCAPGVAVGCGVLHKVPHCGKPLILRSTPAGIFADIIRYYSTRGNLVALPGVSRAVELGLPPSFRA